MFVVVVVFTRSDYETMNYEKRSLSEACHMSRSLKLMYVIPLYSLNFAFFQQLAREVLDEGVKAIDVGVTTDEVDRVVHEASVERECYPSPLNYYKFPKSCCT